MLCFSTSIDPQKGFTELVFFSDHGQDPVFRMTRVEDREMGQLLENEITI